MTARTVESYFAAYSEEETECHEKSDDFQVSVILSCALVLVEVSIVLHYHYIVKPSYSWPVG